MGQVTSSSCPVSSSQTDHMYWTCREKGTISNNSKSNWYGNTCGNDDLTLTLPDECLAMIFGTLSCHDRNNCSLVCKRWKSIDSMSRQSLVLVARSEMSHLLPSLLSRFRSVSVLALKCSRKIVSIDDDALARIPALLPSLKKLKVKGCIDISDNGLHAFALHRPPLLTKLSFASCGFGSRGLISLLVNCPSIQDLTIKRLRKLDGQNIPLSLDGYPYSSMDLVKEENSDPYKQQKMKEMKQGDSIHQLEKLCIKDLHNARLFIPLLCSYGQSLKTLIVCRSSGNWDRVLGSLQGRTTGIAEIHVENVQMGDAGLVSISTSCPDLQVLYLSRATDCTDAGLSAIANSCRKLRKLHVDAWSRFGSRTIGDAGVLSIAIRCTHIQEIVLMGVPITVASLDVLASNCPALERMALCNTESVGDFEMTIIGAKFSALRKLCIKNCPISDSGIQAIGEGCPSLVKLKVKRCRGVTQASVSKLRMQRSSLVVSVDKGSILFERERTVSTVDELQDGYMRGRRMPTSAFPNARPRPRSTRTRVICSSRSALLLGAKFGRKRSNEGNSHTEGF